MKNEEHQFVEIKRGNLIKGCRKCGYIVSVASTKKEIPPCRGKFSCENERMMFMSMLAASKNIKNNLEVKYITILEYVNVVNEMISKIKRQDYVMGIAKSGLIGASIISSVWNVPLFTIDVEGKINYVGGGYRQKKIDVDNILINKEGLVFDDTIANGYTMQKLSKILDDKKIKYKVAVAFCSDNPRYFVPDYIGKFLPFPHILEWNIFESEWGKNNCCYDYDDTLLINDYIPSFYPKKINTILTLNKNGEEIIKKLKKENIEVEKVIICSTLQEKVDWMLKNNKKIYIDGDVEVCKEMVKMGRGKIYALNPIVKKLFRYEDII